jgi:hypothetical protein
MPNFSTTVKMKLKYIMMKIYNPQILFWVQTQNPRIYEITNPRKLIMEKYVNSIIRSRPRRLHINTDCMDSVEDYDRQWEKRQTYAP